MKTQIDQDLTLHMIAASCEWSPKLCGIWSILIHPDLWQLVSLQFTVYHPHPLVPSDPSRTQPWWSWTVSNMFQPPTVNPHSFPPLKGSIWNKRRSTQPVGMSQVGRHEASPGNQAELQRLIVRGREEKLLVQGQVHATHRRKVELPGRFWEWNIWYMTLIFKNIRKVSKKWLNNYYNN